MNRHRLLWAGTTRQFLLILRDLAIPAVASGQELELLHGLRVPASTCKLERGFHLQVEAGAFRNRVRKADGSSVSKTDFSGVAIDRCAGALHAAKKACLNWTAIRVLHLSRDEW